MLEIDGVDGNGNTALHLAAGGGHLHCVQCLINHGADYKKGSGGLTPAQLAEKVLHGSIHDDRCIPHFRIGLSLISLVVEPPQ